MNGSRKRTMNTLVSIITPVHNGAEYIEETIQSVLKQSYQDWEMLIIDDASYDATDAIVSTYTKKDQRIQLISLDENKGVSHARNVGIKMAKGRYIAFLDSDDLWMPEKLTEQVAFMKEGDYAFTFSSYIVCDESNNWHSKKISIDLEVDYETLLKKGNQIACLTVMIDKNKVDISMPNIPHEDYATWLSITKKGVKAFGINQPLAIYRRRSKSVSRNKLRCMNYTYNIYRNHLKLAPNDLVKAYLGYMYFSGKKNLKLVIARLMRLEG